MEDEEYSIDIAKISGETMSITIPATPNIGDIHFDTTSMDVKVYGNSGDWVTISDSDVIWDNINVTQTLFEDTMPDPQELKEMCVEYPGLEKAYENFKAIYKMVEQDWRGKQKDQGQFPF